MENPDLTGIIFRVSIMYLYALTLIRMSGKQSLSQLTCMDFVVVLIIGDLFDDVFWTEVPIPQALVAFAVLVLIHMLITLASSRNKRFYRLVTSPERRMVEAGKLEERNLQREWMRPETLQSELRMKGEEHLREIKEAWLELNGKVSVIKESASKPVQKKDKRLFG
jgi:uncharacterized membrane protein YcaP (DUF421 family)